MRVYAPRAFRRAGVDYGSGWLDLPQALADLMLGDGQVLQDVPDAGAGGLTDGTLLYGPHTSRPAASAALAGKRWTSVDLRGGTSFVCDGTSWIQDGAAVASEARAASEVTASRTLTSADDGVLLKVSSGTAVTLTVPAGLPLGFCFRAMQCGAGKVTVAAGAGASVQAQGAKFSAAAQYAVIEVLPTLTVDQYVVTGQSGT